MFSWIRRLCFRGSVLRGPYAKVEEVRAAVEEDVERQQSELGRQDGPRAVDFHPLTHVDTNAVHESSGQSSGAGVRVHVHVRGETADPDVETDLLSREMCDVLRLKAIHARMEKWSICSVGTGGQPASPRLPDLEKWYLIGQTRGCCSTSMLKVAN